MHHELVKRHVNEPHDAMKLVPLGVFMSLPSSPHQHDIILHFSCNHWCAIKNSFWINWATSSQHFTVSLHNRKIKIIFSVILVGSKISNEYLIGEWIEWFPCVEHIIPWFWIVYDISNTWKNGTTKILHFRFLHPLSIYKRLKQYFNKITSLCSFPQRIITTSYNHTLTSPILICN